MKVNATLETLIDLVEGLVQEEGFKTLRYSETDNIGTTEYDCLVLQDSNGKEFKIGFDESWKSPDENFNWTTTNYIK